MKELLNKILQEPNAIIAFCALVISIVSLILALISAFMSRKNNRLSVRPLAYILPPDYENRIAIILQNKGTGPLITKEIRFIDNNGCEKSSLIEFMPKLEEGYYWTTFSQASKIILRPSEEKILLEFKGESNDIKFVHQRNAIRKILGSINVEVAYVSIFNEKKPFKLTYKLSWFNR